MHDCYSYVVMILSGWQEKHWCSALLAVSAFVWTSAVPIHVLLDCLIQHYQRWETSYLGIFLHVCLQSLFLLQQIIMLTGCPDQFLHRKSRLHYFCYWHKTLWGHSVTSYSTLSSHKRIMMTKLFFKESHLYENKKMFIYFAWALVSGFLVFFPAHWMFNSHCTIHSKYRKDMISRLDFKGAELPLN